MLFNGWDSLLRILVVGVLAYVTLIVFLRLSGKRTLAKMNAFDLVVTVALGSTLATVLLSKQVAYTEGALAFALLISLQYVVSWSSVRSHWVRRLVTGEPIMLLYNGELLPSAMRQSRVTQDQVNSAIRAAGVNSVGNIQAVILETNGSFSVVQYSELSGNSSLKGVDGPHHPDKPRTSVNG